MDGMDVSEVVMFVGNDTAVSPAAGGLPLVTLSDVEDRVLAGKPRKLFRALSYLHQHYSERYQWFLLVSGEVYVHGQQLGVPRQPRPDQQDVPLVTLPQVEPRTARD